MPRVWSAEPAFDCWILLQHDVVQREEDAETRKQGDKEKKAAFEFFSSSSVSSVSSVVKAFTPKTCDFGLAKCLDSDSSETRVGEVMGTPSYMAPEQASGLVRGAGSRASGRWGLPARLAQTEHNLGNFYRNLGQAEKAESSYLSAR